MKKAEKIWSKDAPKMKAFLLQDIKETGLAWKTLIEQHLEDYQNGKILDVGCGTGFISLLLAQIGFEVIAIDNNAAMLKEAEKHLRSWDFQIKSLLCLKTQHQWISPIIPLMR